MAVAKFAVWGRKRLGLMRPYGDALLLHSMRWDDEVRDPTELAHDDVDLSEKEISEAIALLEAMSVEHLADVGEAVLTDQYREALVEVIEAKAEHRAPAAPWSRGRADRAGHGPLGRAGGVGGQGQGVPRRDRRRRRARHGARDAQANEEDRREGGRAEAGFLVAGRWGARSVVRSSRRRDSNPSNASGERVCVVLSH